MNGNNEHPKAKFVINNIVDTDDNPFDRQERIAWWDQEKLKNARVMVVGAGAIGNETLKNLALLGIGNIFIVDFDTISTSNLSRTVLFRQADKGKKKAEIAALRTKEMSLLEDANVSWFHGDAVWDLGTGVFRSMDIVLGCLDNVETRLGTNRQCWLAKTPWIDSGIYELGGHVSVFIPPEPPCYQCGASNEQLIAARKRYSCDDFKRSVLDEGKMPTVQITSSIISAIQVQEAIKFLCGQRVESGKKIYFQGRINDFAVLGLPKNENCDVHGTSYPEIIPLPLSSSVKLKDFLEYVTQDQYSGADASLDFRSDRTFVVSVSCNSCGSKIEMYKPTFRIFDTEIICGECKQKGIQANSELMAEKQIEVCFNLLKTDEKILDMSLSELGIPNRHVVAVYDKHNNYKYYELSEDTSIFQTC
ncbi:UBA/THIF-type NAD/FAD-binding protein [Candidatus Thiomargarita nelsonii]|uniref:UBA/THIF-type NAD/FAD-binding protein n=1 Tax=Candidatus Thiomargarita nelsonii TaxID=1003181 RepID=A0A176RUM7_9GAMM|nr:UBA/THIF-type NAD/FAD-binding protein [Candidatus Thiomargarita nelsonii]